MWPIVLVALVGAPDPSAPTPAPPSTPTSTPDALTPQALARLAADASPSVRAQLAHVRGKVADTRALDQRFWPKITATARYTRMSPNDPTVIAPPGLPLAVEIPGALEDQIHLGIGVALPLSDWLLRWGSATAAGREGEVAERLLADLARSQAALRALETWYGWQRARLGAEVAAAALKDAEVHLAAASVLERAEVAAVGDVKLAEARAAEARLGLARARHGQALAERALTTLLDREVDASALPIDTSSLWPPPDLTREGLIARAIAARPEAQAIAAGVRALGLREEVVMADRLPRLDVVANAQLANPSPRGLQNEDELVGLWDASAVLSWRLDGLWEADTEDDRLAAERARLAADHDALVDGISLEIESALRTIADADAATAATTAMLAAAEEGHRARAKAYAAGKASSLDLSEAERQLTQARLGLVDATIDRRLGELHLAYALGIQLAR